MQSPAHTNTALLPDGTEVDTSSEAWRLHCLAEWKARQPECDRHVRNLLGMFAKPARDSYLRELAAKDRPMAERVWAEFKKAKEGKR